MGIDFFFGRWDLFFARQREKVFLVFFWCFFGVFVLCGLCAGGGVDVRAQEIGCVDLSQH